MRYVLVAALLAFALPAMAQEKRRPAQAVRLRRRGDAAMAKARAETRAGNTVEVLASVGPYPAQLEYRTRHHARPACTRPRPN